MALFSTSNSFAIGEQDEDPGVTIIELSQVQDTDNLNTLKKLAQQFRKMINTRITELKAQYPRVDVNDSSVQQIIDAEAGLSSYGAQQRATRAGAADSFGGESV